MASGLILAIVGSIAVIVLAVFSLRVVREYERVVAFRLGRLRGALGPGIVIRLPLLDTLVPVDLRVVTLTIPPQEDRKSTRLNSSHVAISYAVFCLKKKKMHRIK